MNDAKPLDLDAIRTRYREWSPDWERLSPDVVALLDEVDRLRAAAMELVGASQAFRHGDVTREELADAELAVIDLIAGGAA